MGPVNYSEPVDIEFADDMAASASQTTAGLLIIVSRTVKEQIQLLHVQNVDLKGRLVPFLRAQMVSSRNYLPLDGISLRANFSSAWGAFMSQHVVAIHKHLDRDSTDVVAYTAWRFSTLTAWGEASAARELALDLKIPVTTVHNRLRLAREKGILPSPGTGARFGR